MVAQGYSEWNLVVRDDPKNLAKTFLGRTAENDISSMYYKVRFLDLEHFVHVLVGSLASLIAKNNMSVSQLENLE